MPTALTQGPFVKKVSARSVACQDATGDVAVDCKAGAEWSHLKLQILGISVEEKHLMAGEYSTFSHALQNTKNEIIEPKLRINGTSVDMRIILEKGKAVVECILAKQEFCSAFPISATLTTKYKSQAAGKTSEWEIADHPFQITNPALAKNSGACAIM